MTDASRAETRIMAARTTANLVLCPIVGSQTLEAGEHNNNNTSRPLESQNMLVHALNLWYPFFILSLSYH